MKQERFQTCVTVSCVCVCACVVYAHLPVILRMYDVRCVSCVGRGTKFVDLGFQVFIPHTCLVKPTFSIHL